MQRPALAAVSAAVAGLVAGVTISGADALTLPSWMKRDKEAPAVVAQAAPATAAAAPLAAAPAVLGAAQVPNYRALVQTYGPAVVGVTVSGLRQAGDDEGDDDQPAAGPPMDDPFFRFFRGVPGFRMPPGYGNQGAQPFRGQGSGFIVSADGVILTNAHVVRDAKQVTVKLSDRREFAAKVLGSDPVTDVAVLKVDARNLPTVALGDSKQVQVGDWVLAIGSPFGFEQTATQGIVSAKGRSLPGDSYVPFIQTDAAVNPGNSGGPLFDAGGRVIGINSQIYSRSGGFQGLAFAIPVDVALRVKDQIVAKGRVDHARLGVTLQDLSAPLAESFGLDAPSGALVASVGKDSAAAKAGLKAGDVIVAVDGQQVQTAGDVSSRVGMAAPGEKLQLKVWRDKSAQEISVALGAAAKGARETLAQAEGGQLGLAVRPLQREERRAVGVDHGLVVEQASGPAAEAGIQRGDVVLALNGRAVHSVEQVSDALKAHPRQVALLILRDGQQIFVPVPLG
jgi:serine protease Do